MRTLVELEEGQVATVAKIDGDTRFLSRIVSIGIILGGEIEILRNEKKMPLLIFSRDSMIALNRNESAKIYVEVLS